MSRCVVGPVRVRRQRLGLWVHDGEPVKYAPHKQLARYQIVLPLASAPTEMRSVSYSCSPKRATEVMAPVIPIDEKGRAACVSVLMAAYSNRTARTLL